jgi:cation/acetate symporter
MSIVVFLAFVLFVLVMSFYLGSRTKSASGYYAAGGQIHWAVNGVAFAGDYLSAASFLGICGMIATLGYDGFLYSIGYLAGWIVALFVIAEPMKRLGKYTFTDALDSKYNSRAIKLTAAISTLIVSIFYLIPQMVGAGVLVEPLLNIPHAWGVIMVGAIVITIVATAGMASTTYVQFLKGALLIIFSTIMVGAVLMRGLSTEPDQGGKVPFHKTAVLDATQAGSLLAVADPAYTVREVQDLKKLRFARLAKDGKESWWMVEGGAGKTTLKQVQWVTKKGDGKTLINGEPASETNTLRQVNSLASIDGQSGPAAKTGAVDPISFLSKLGSKKTTALLWKQAKLTNSDKEAVTVYYPQPTTGNRIMRPGLKLKMEGTLLEKLDFVSLMLALFFGTAALPHILIRYYTVPSPACARKSTIVAIASIGFFYVLTLYMGLGAMVNATVNPVTDNMSAPLLARSFGELLFAVISAIAFATVLGTVSGLIVAASGAVAHDLLDRYARIDFTERQKVRAGKIAAFAVGLIAIVLGILFQGMNVSFLVGLAFAVAASANLPAMIMLLFWKKTSSVGIAASVTVGIVSSLALIAVSPEMYGRYGLDPDKALVPFNNPGIFSMPLSFLTLVVVSLMTQKSVQRQPEPAAA